MPVISPKKTEFRLANYMQCGQYSLVPGYNFAEVLKSNSKLLHWSFSNNSNNLMQILP